LLTLKVFPSTLFVEVKKKKEGIMPDKHKEVDEKKVKRVIRNYLRSEINSIKCKSGACNMIECPSCNHRVMEPIPDWKCLNLDCNYRFPEELTPPTPNELRDYYKKKTRERQIENLLSEAGIKI